MEKNERLRTDVRLENFSINGKICKMWKTKGEKRGIEDHSVADSGARPVGSFCSFAT